MLWSLKYVSVPVLLQFRLAPFFQNCTLLTLKQLIPTSLPSNVRAVTLPFVIPAIYKEPNLFAQVKEQKSCLCN